MKNKIKLLLILATICPIVGCAIVDGHRTYVGPRLDFNVSAFGVGAAVTVYGTPTPAPSPIIVVQHDK